MTDVGRSPKVGGGKSKPPMSPGSGVPQREPGGMGRRNFIKGVLGLAGAGALGYGVKEVFFNKTAATEAPPVTTIGTVTTTPVVETTVPATTEAPPTTLLERVFSSPEQQAQVEAVEANTAKYVTLTKDDLKAYEKVATFRPYPSGFGTILEYEGESAFRMLVINLGTYTVPAGDGVALLHRFQSVKDTGEMFVATSILAVTDSQFAAQFPNSTEPHATVYNPINDTNEYGTTNDFEGEGFFNRGIVGTELINTLNTTVGEPMVIELTADSAYLADSGFPTVANPEMKSVVEEVLSAGFGLEAVVEKYSPELLKKFGISVSADQVSQQELLGYGSVSEAFSSLPTCGLIVLFSNTPPII